MSAELTLVSAAVKKDLSDERSFTYKMYNLLY